MKVLRKVKVEYGGRKKKPCIYSVELEVVRKVKIIVINVKYFLIDIVTYIMSYEYILNLQKLVLLTEKKNKTRIVYKFM